MPCNEDRNRGRAESIEHHQIVELIIEDMLADPTTDQKYRDRYQAEAKRFAEVLKHV
jgi:hypothetical protein